MVYQFGPKEINDSEFLGVSKIILGDFLWCWGFMLNKTNMKA